MSVNSSNLYELEECSSWVVENKFTRVALQFPQNRLVDSVDVVKRLQEMTTIEHEYYVVLSASCSVDYVGPLHLGPNIIEGIICFGTSCLSNSQSPLGKIPVLFIFGSSHYRDVEDYVKQELDNLEVKIEDAVILYDLANLALIQSLFSTKPELFEQNVAKVRNASSNWNFSTNASSLIVEPEFEKHVFGHFSLPREISSYKYAIWIGSCSNLYLKVNSPSKIMEINASNQSTNVINSRKELMKRISLVEKAKLVDKFGIVFSNTLPSIGDSFSRIKELTARVGKESYMISLVQFADETKFGNFGELEAFVIIASCCCASLLQRVHINVPILTLTEFEITLGLKRHYGGIVWNAEGPEVGALLPEIEAQENHSKDLIEYKNCLKNNWYGLEVAAGQQAVGQVEEGSKGIASKYDYETSLKND